MTKRAQRGGTVWGPGRRRDAGWRPGSWARRRGAVLALCAIMLVALIGMVGLVVDGAILTATFRQAQNAADAAALAAAFDRMRGKSVGEATTTATTFVRTYNGLSNAAAPVVNSPPSSGAYAGRTAYVEVIVTVPVSTYLIHVLPGVANTRNVQARAVAGYEAHSAGEGVMVLDPGARPGLEVTNPNAVLRVNGSITVNSEGGGVDENGNPVSGTQWAANANPGFIYSPDVRIVGGIKPVSGSTPDPNFRHYDYPANTSYPVDAVQLPEPDPLIELPPPMVSNGAIATERDAANAEVNITNQGAQNIAYGNYIAQGGETLIGTTRTADPGEVVLFPGRYRSISISGGKVYFTPGIYIISPQKNTPNALKITGTNTVVNAEGVMFYNTYNSYSVTNGTPDINDGERDPRFNSDPTDVYSGGIDISTGIRLSPIDTNRFGYVNRFPGDATVAPTIFNGMLFYQRRWNNRPISITGNASDGLLAGTLYAKWSQVTIAGQGTYDAQFIVGSMKITGNGNITILAAGEARGRANQIYLVE